MGSGSSSGRHQAARVVHGKARPGLYWAAVVNGLLAQPLMAAVMWLANNPRLVGPDCRLPRWLWLLG